MANNFSKLWIQKDQNESALKRALQAIDQLGKALPCRVVSVDGAIVTVAFEVDSSPWTLPQVAIPKAESNWLRMPTQVGDFGLAVPSDVYLGGISGLGGGTANMAQVAGLGALLFVPVSNKSSPPDDPNAAQVMGPNGAIIRTQDGNTKIVANETSITLTVGSISVVIDSAGIHFHGAVDGNSTATFTGEGTFNDGHTVSAHHHQVTGIQTGGSTVTSQTPTG